MIKRTFLASFVLGLVLAVLRPAILTADDWPMWRYDAGRTAASPMTLPEPLHVLWSRQLPASRPAFEQSRLQFDRNDEPVVLGKRLFVGSTQSDHVTAYDTDTGEHLWRFYTQGPVRLAPVGWRDRVYFGSDDGHLYCLDAAEGTLIWKFRAAPSNRKVLGNQRMISMWPVRGGPVLRDGRIYFAAGVWSMEGVFVYALDAEDGRVLWRNDRGSFVHGVHPHDATAMGGLTPQGYLVIEGDDLIVPCGTAYPARFDRATGELTEFQLPAPGRIPGGWFAALSPERRRGETAEPASRLVFDRGINTDRHEGRWYVGQGEEQVRDRIQVGDRQWSFDQGYGGRAAQTMLAADGKIFLVTEDARLWCFGSGSSTTDAYHLEVTPLPATSPSWQRRVAEMLSDQHDRHGYALVMGDDSLQIAGELVDRSSLHVIVLHADADEADRMRQTLDAAGLYGARVSVLTSSLVDSGLPPYFAQLVVVADGSAPTVDQCAAIVASCLRPHGGAAYFFDETLPSQGLIAIGEQAGWETSQPVIDGRAVGVIRAVELPGALNFTEPFQPSLDERVRAPVGVLWYNDLAGFFKRSPPPMFVDGVMRAHDKLWMGYPDGDRPPYKLGEPVYQDVYTGRVLSDDEVPAAELRFPAFDAQAPQPSQYRPPTQQDAWRPKQPVIGQRTDPLTGQLQPRSLPKSYGCDGGFDYGWIYTMRSGTAAFYDKRLESGTIHISGPRSGCTNSIVPACGLLNLPYYFTGCTCSYPLPSSLSMISMPATHEQWSTWGQAEEQPVTGIQRVGINLGAPGVRMSPAGTLWLDYPNLGGPAPVLAIRTEPAQPTWSYQHSLFLDGGYGWPWVGASAGIGLSRLTVDGIQPGRYLVRLSFAEPAVSGPGQRVFDVLLQDRLVLENVDIVNEAEGALRVVTFEMEDIQVEGTLDLQLIARSGDPLLSGIELVPMDQPRDELPRW